jgi:hypothetical protein
MRIVILGCVLGLALAASAQAAPLSPRPAAIEVGAVPPFELVRDGCGRGWHRTHWRDQWGNWHTGAVEGRHALPFSGHSQADAGRDRLGSRRVRGASLTAG